MRAVIISGGTIKQYEYIARFIRQDDVVICADSGYNHAKNMGIKPQVLVGDFDSISEKPKGIEIIEYPAKKDFTDTEIALEWARTHGFRDFLMLGVTGTRLDHTLANIMLLTSMYERGESAEIIDEHNRIFLTESEIIINEPPGTLLSVIPLTRCQGVTNSGLEYPLCDVTLETYTARGVSNVIVNPPAQVSVRRGKLLVIISKD